MHDMHTPHRRARIRALSRPQRASHEWIAGILAGIVLALLLNLF